MMWQPILVLVLVVVYWGSAALKGVSLRRKTGKSSHPWPKNRFERALILIWCGDILVWLAQPILVLAKVGAQEPGLNPMWSSPPAECAGAALAAAGLALSWIAWWQMGDSWRLGTSKKDQTELVTGGVFGWVRHPIYASQAWLLVGTFLVLPTPLLAGMSIVHLICLYAKAAHEERHMILMQGEAYERYRRRVGGFWPKLFARQETA